VTRTERELIEEALEHLEVLGSHLQRGGMDDPLIVDAVCMRLSAAIASLSNLPEARRMSLFGHDWHAMWSTRNHIAHAYEFVDMDIIKATVERRVPALMATLRQSIVVDEA
jgi:uncharacterized protein with HEPN domain